MNSIGMIETRGLIAAIEAADIMVKSSNVNLISRQQIGAGLVTITVEGDVGAVRAAVDAAVEGVETLGGYLISSHVIPSPANELETFFDDEKIKDTVEAIENEYREEIAERIGSEEEVENIDLEIIEKNLEENTDTEENEEADKAEENSAEENSVEKKAEEAEIEMFSTIDKKGFEELIEKFGLEKSIESIKHMTLTNIRKLAKEYETLSLSDAEVAKASKKKVIEAIENCHK